MTTAEFRNAARERDRRNGDARTMFEKLTREEHWRLERGATLYHSSGGTRLRYEKMTAGGFGLALSEDNGETWRVIAVQDWRLVRL